MPFGHDVAAAVPTDRNETGARTFERSFDQTTSDHNSELVTGSILIYNLYVSSPVNPADEDTRITLTNSQKTQPVFVRLFFISAHDCLIADAYLCLTQGQTVSFQTSDLDPGIRGYLIAIASNDEGCPIKFNHLMGEAFIKMASGHTANLVAQAVPAIAAEPAVCDGIAMAVLKFDGVNYASLPHTLAVSDIPSPNEENVTLLVVNNIGGDFMDAAGTIGTIRGLLYDEKGVPHSFSLWGSCQLRGVLSEYFPRTAPRLNQIIGGGHSGWMKLTPRTDKAIMGAVINFNAHERTKKGAFNQGHNLHWLSFTQIVRIEISVFPLQC